MQVYNPYERLEVQLYSPVKRRVVRSLAIAALSLAAITGYAYGYWSYAKEAGSFAETLEERSQLLEQTLKTKTELQQLRLQVRVAETESVLDRQATKEIKQAIKNLEAIRDRLKNELKFYQQVITMHE